MDNTETDPAVSRISESLTQSAESQRALIQEMTSFAKDETKRFFNLRLERNNAVLEKLSNCAGLPGLIGLQQEWLRDLVQDYSAQNMRFAGAFRGLAHDALATASAAASENIDRMQTQAADAIHQAQDFAQQAGDRMENAAQDVNNNFNSNLNNNYVAH